MSQPAINLLPGEPQSDWLDVYQAAVLMEMSHRHVRRFCTEWMQRGLAVKKGDGWLISPRANSRLNTSYRGGLEVIQQAGLLIQQGVPEKNVTIAKHRANVVEAYWRYRDRSPALSVLESRASFAAKWSMLNLPIADPVSVKTLERWESAYRQSELCELLPKYNGGLGRKGQWSKPAKELFYHLYFGPEKRQVATCYYIMRGKAIENDWQIPSLRSVQRHVQGAPEDVKTLYREGRQAFRGKAEPKIRRAFDGIPSGEHIEGDERTCDFYVRVPSAKGWKRIRPIITAWLDRRSRIIFGWWLDARGNSDTILASFKRGVLDYGRPKELTIDNGEDYKSVAGNPRKGSRWSEFDDKRLRHCFSELDIKVHLTLPYTPWSKGQIESFFSTMAERFDKFMESYCGNKPENRPEGANRVLVEKLPTLEEARSRFGDFVNAYHQHPHTGDGMNGLCPAQAHEQYLAGVAPVTPETLDYLCAKRIGPKRVGQNGIQHHHVVFGQRQGEVWKLRGRKVWLRVLPDVADRVWVETEDGKPICVAQAETIRGATQDDIRTAAKLRKDRKKAARTYFEDVVPKRHARPIDDIHEAQRIAASADRIDAPEPPTPMTVRLTRPDIDAALARRNDSGVGGEYDSAVAGEILHMPSFELPEDEEVIETGNAFARSFEDAGEEILEGPDEAGQRLRTLADAG